MIKLEPKNQDQKKNIISRIINPTSSTKEPYFKYPHPLLTTCQNSYIKLYLRDSSGKFVDNTIKCKICYIPLQIRHLLVSEISSKKKVFDIIKDKLVICR